MEKEIVEYYKALITELRDELELKENELSASRFMVGEFVKGESMLNK